MKRFLRYLAIAFASVLLLLVLALAWLLGSNAGARWLVGQGSALLPPLSRVEKVEGSLAGGLTLSGLHSTWSGGTLTIEELRLRWHPAALFRAHLHISELTIAGVTVDLVASPAGSDPAPPARPWQWPKVSGWPLQVTAALDRLALERVTLRSNGEELLSMASASTRLNWREGVIELSELAVAGPRLTGQGESRVGLVAPALFADLHGTAPAFAERVKEWSIAIDLADGKANSLNGSFRLALTAPAGASLALQGELAIDAKKLHFSAVKLVQQPPAGEVTASATVALDESQPRLQLTVEFRDVDLQAHVGVATRLSGRLELQGAPEDYRGTFTVANAGADWRQLTLRGELQGNLQELAVSRLAGTLLQGTISGGAQLNWTKAPLLRAQLQGRGLDAGTLLPLPATGIDLDLDTAWQTAGPGSLQLHLLRGSFAGTALAGELAAELHPDDLLLSRLNLQGDGLVLRGDGRLSERLNFNLEFARPEGAQAKISGFLTANGWLSRRDGRWAGAATLSARQFRSSLLAAETLTANLAVAQNGPVQLWLDGAELVLAGVPFTSARARGAGSFASHQLQLSLLFAGGKVDLAAVGGGGTQGWQGRIESFAGEGSYGPWRLTAPVDLAIGGTTFTFSPLHLEGSEGEVVNLTGTSASGGTALTLTGDWQNLKLARLQGLTPELALQGRSQGELAVTTAGGKLTHLRTSGTVVNGAVAANGRTLGFSGDFSFSGDNAGQKAALKLDLSDGGGLRGAYHSPAPLRDGLPGPGTLQASWSGLPPQLLLPTAASGVQVSGGLSGELSGHTFADGRFDLNARSTLLDGNVAWQDGARQISASLREVVLSAAWRDASLAAEAKLSLGEHGRLVADLQLPLPARLPLRLPDAGVLAGTLVAQFNEQGVLGALLPGLVKESRGAVAADLVLAGTVAAPELRGTLRLSDVGGYLPTIGITLAEGSCVARLEGETLLIEELSVKSGEGRLLGTGTLSFAGGAMAGYSGTLKGEKVQLLNLPELRVNGNPDLTFSGTAEQLRLRGDILLGRVQLLGSNRPAVKLESGDVVLVRTEPVAVTPQRALALDAEVKVILGEQVLINIAGIDAHLEGNVLVQAAGWSAREITGRGKLEVKKGTYAAYGVSLEIEKGNILFAGGAIDDPTLDVVAVRKIDEIKAGVRIGGTPRTLTVKLYSEPTLQDTDILSYIVFGEPLSADVSQTTLLSTAAAALLSQGNGPGLQDKVLKRLGVDKVEVALPEGTMESSVITVGKYLSPDLYISLGQSVFSGFEQLQLRYDLDDKWQVESTMGDESAVDLYYKIEFD